MNATRTFEEVLAEHPVLRQSLLGAWDNCALSTLFELRYGQDWSTHPQARGTLFHRFAAKALITMRQQGEKQIPVSEALEILEEVLLQRDVPPQERVRLPLRELPGLRNAVIKFAADNEFNVHAIVDVERRLEAEIEYPAPDGGTRRRTISGQLDALIARPPDGAIVLDWKESWGLPPASPQGDAGGEDPDHLSYMGFYQQRFYGLLVLRNFPAVQSVTLREFYPRWSKARQGTVTRENLPAIERDIARLAATLDDALMAGFDSPVWSPSPGRHCGFCLKPGDCPIEREARGTGAVDSFERAKQYAAEREVAWRVYRHRTDALKTWADLHGPVPLKSAKGRREVGWVKNKTGDGRTFKSYTPEESDHGPKAEDLAVDLEAALRESLEGAS